MKKLYIEVTYILKPGKRDAFLQAIAENKIAEASRNEPGCGRYEYVLPENDPDIVLLYEIWESVEAHQIHSTLDHFKKLGELKAIYVEDTKIVKEEK